MGMSDSIKRIAVLILLLALTVAGIVFAMRFIGDFFTLEENTAPPVSDATLVAERIVNMDDIPLFRRDLDGFVSPDQIDQFRYVNVEFPARAADILDDGEAAPAPEDEIAFLRENLGRFAERECAILLEALASACELNNSDIATYVGGLDREAGGITMGLRLSIVPQDIYTAIPPNARLRARQSENANIRRQLAQRFVREDQWEARRAVYELAADVCASGDPAEACLFQRMRLQVIIGQLGETDEETRLTHSGDFLVTRLIGIRDETPVIAPTVIEVGE